NVVEEEDGELIHFLGANSSSGTKKYQGSNSSDGDNIEDRVKIAGEVIGSGDEIVEEEDEEQIRFLGGNSFSGTKKYRGSNSNDGGNTGDGVKIAGGVIGSDDEIGNHRSDIGEDRCPWKRLMQEIKIRFSFGNRVFLVISWVFKSKQGFSTYLSSSYIISLRRSVSIKELALLCGRMFLEESDKIEKYVGGLPDMIYGSVVASKPKTMQEVVEIATELMDKKIRTFVERQTENKRKQNNNQQQQPQNKRQNTGRAYAAGTGEKKLYEGSKPLCPKCNYHHDGLCAPKCHKCNRVGHLARDCRSPANANTANN
ncbi:reverse transcriptase domain-containing protein, partial [Tanacetum coccineum]